VSASDCPIDITWFPFDDQYCELTYESKNYKSNEINISRMELAVELASYSPNGQWELLGKFQRQLLPYAGRYIYTRFHGLLKIVTMSGQCVICQVNVHGLGYN